MGQTVGAKLDIAIAGAGPAGLATALYLHRDGHKVTLFERFDRPHPLGSGLMLQPTGLAVLHDLGLHEQIAALGAPIDGLMGHDARTGRTVLDVRYGSLKGLGRALGVHRAALFNVLHDAVSAKDIPVRTGFTVAGLERAGGCMRLIGGGRREGPFDLVVDALGAGSPLRRYARRPSESVPLTFGAIWATTPWVDGFEARALMQRYRRARVMIGVLPVGRQTADGPMLAAFFWSLKTAEYEALRQAGLAAWKAECVTHWPETIAHLGAIGGFEQMTLARYAHHTLPVPAGEGIAFVGDSAHSTSPQLGQGANMALLDARALALALQRTPGVAEALEHYARLRRWHVRLYQFLSRALTPFYQSDSAALPAVRDFAVAYVAKVPPAPQLLALLVAGQLLNPIKMLGLALPPPLEEVS
jgi:2-polyprenyl-6-methoxyphenol hydroxylase-like FAD-dependent oxidoreductase